MTPAQHQERVVGLLAGDDPVSADAAMLAYLDEHPYAAWSFVRRAQFVVAVLETQQRFRAQAREEGAT